MASPSIDRLMDGLGRAAVEAAAVLALASSTQKDAALAAAAAVVRTRRDAILDANALDMTAAREHETTAARLDRLYLDARARRGDRHQHRCRGRTA